MPQYYRGICLSGNKKDNAISQPNFYKFKNYWVKLECYLRYLFEKGEVPTLTPDDQIFIPDEFCPKDEHLNFYRKKFNRNQKRWVKQMIKNHKFDKDISNKEGIWRIDFSKLIDHLYKSLADKENLYEITENFQSRKINKELDEYQKLSLLLSYSSFKLQAEFGLIQTGLSGRECLMIKSPTTKRKLVKRV